MDLGRLERESEHCWRIAPSGEMRVPGIIYGDEALVREMDEKVYEQVCGMRLEASRALKASAGSRRRNVRAAG